MGPQRPHLVGLICWILIIGGFGGLVLALKSTGGPSFAQSMASFPYPPVVAETLLFGLRLLMVATGICLYEGQGWARYVFIGIMPLFFLNQYFGLGTAQTAADAEKLMLHKLVLAGEVVLYLVSIGILFLPSVRRYYHPPQYVDE
jgi:hypothetical protein